MNFVESAVDELSVFWVTESILIPSSKWQLFPIW